MRDYPGEAGFNKWLRSYKNNAKSRKLEFTLTSEQFRVIVQRNCYFCDAGPKLRTWASPGHGHKSKESIEHSSYRCNGIDRLDNDKGYTPINSVTSCGECNLAKGTKSLQEFINWIQKVHNNLELG